MALMRLLYIDEIQAFKTRMNVAVIIIIMKNCNDFQLHRCVECMRELEAAKDQGSSKLQTYLVQRNYVISIFAKSHYP